MMDEEREYYSLTRTVFRVLAPFYDIVTLPMSGLRDQVVRFTGARDVSRVLDVATGTGKQAFAFARRGHAVVGIDLSEDMLRVAEKNNRHGNLRFEIGDATHLRFEDSTFDVSCVSFALHDMPLAIREKVLKEMARVTKPSATIVIVDYALPDNTVSRWVIYQLIRLYEGKYYSRFVNSDLEELLRKVGIQVKEEVRVLLGAGRILKGIRVDDRQ